MFGEVLREIRTNHKNSLRELGEKTDIIFTYISKVETGVKSPSKDFVSKMIKAYPLEKKKLLKAYLNDLLPEGDTLEVFKDQKNSIEDIHKILFSKLSNEDKKIYLNNLVEKIEFQSYKHGKLKEDKKDIEKIKKYIENL